MTKLQIDSKQEVKKITCFIKSTLKEQGFEKAVIPVSGGVDSNTSLLLLAKAVNPKNIIAVKLPFAKQNMSLADLVIRETRIPKENVIETNIEPVVNKIISIINHQSSIINRVRRGNIMARIRMIIIYDLAKKHSALVCGAENKSEYMLGYYTRFGDEACDFAPIRHLYKIQVYQLAKYLGMSEKIIKQAPSASLWPGQTDEKEFGFTYEEADQVLYLYFEERLPIPKLEKKGFKNTKKIISWVKKNGFKKKVPYNIVNARN